MKIEDVESWKEWKVQSQKRKQIYMKRELVFEKKIRNER